MLLQRQAFSRIPGGPQPFQSANCASVGQLRHHARRSADKRSLIRGDATPNQGGLGSGVQKVMRKIQAALPIVGLFSRLAATSGGIGSDVLSYPEYCRSLIDASPVGFDEAVSKWEKLYGKEGSRRNVLLCLWMSRDAPGLLPARNVILAARRLRVTFDIEMEMDRFEGTRDEALKKFDLVERPPGALQEKISLAVDSLCTLGPGLSDGQPLQGEAADVLTNIVAGAFSEADGVLELVRRTIAERPARARAYLL